MSNALFVSEIAGPAHAGSTSNANPAVITIIFIADAGTENHLQQYE
jgi:hypothetical protein